MENEIFSKIQNIVKKNGKKFENGEKKGGKKWCMSPGCTGSTRIFPR